MECTNTIMEIITIYRKMKKGRENQNIYRMLLNIEAGLEEVVEMKNISEEKRISMSIEDGNVGGHLDGNEVVNNVDHTEDKRISMSMEDGNVEGNNLSHTEDKRTSVYDFSRYRNLGESKYILFSKSTSLIQSDCLFDRFEELNLTVLKHYWLNIFNPSEHDLQILGLYFNINDITLMDIRERNTEEKIEIFKNYSFISLRLLSEGNLYSNEDIDFNILLFKDFVITTHDKKWGGISDITNFLSLICCHTVMVPDWVFFSIIVEFLQDIKHIIDTIGPEVVDIQTLSSNLNLEIENLLRRNFEVVNKIYSLRKFIKPKMLILSSISTRYNKRVDKKVSPHILHCLKDFNRQEKQAKEYNIVLERCQDLFLALVNMEQSKQGNDMNKVMKRFTQVTFIFLPCQAVASLWGMNVPVPWQKEKGTFYFYILMFFGIVAGFFLYFFMTKVKFKGKKESPRNLEEAQLVKLYNEIEKRKLDSKLYNAKKNELVSVMVCYIQDRNVFWGADDVCQYCNKFGKTVDHLATRCEKMLGHDYTRRHNEVVRCLHLLLLNRYKFKSSKRIRSHSVQEILDNEYAEIRVDTRIKTDVKIRNNRPDIFILDKKKNKITLIEVGITSQDLLQIVETEKLRKYDLLANEASMGVIMRVGMHEKPTPTLKQAIREEDGAK
ncbi:CorA-like metal ion transporter, partial [Hamiltosporidium magnivora]